MVLRLFIAGLFRVLTMPFLVTPTRRFKRLPYVQRIKLAGKKHVGATLLEMMIALFVMGVGMMGILALQTQSIRLNHQAYSYSQAVFLAHDILESMRANRPAANSYQISKTQNIQATTNCAAVNAKCTAQQLKNWDLARWRSNIQQRLPGGEASIGLDGNTFSINIEFDVIRMDKEATINTAQSERQTYTLVTGL